MSTPPPPVGSIWNDWAESLNRYLTRNINQLQYLIGGESAEDNGLLMWDRTAQHPVVSYDGAFIPLAYGQNEPGQGYGYGAFYDHTDQSATSINTGKAITWNTTAHSNNISIGTPTSRIVFAKAGRYYISFTAQLNSTSASTKAFWFWPKLNGTDVAGSTMKITMHANDETKTVSRSGIFQVSANDYLESYFAVDDTGSTLQHYAAESFAPAVPSVSLTVMSV